MRLLLTIRHCLLSVSRHYVPKATSNFFKSSYTAAVLAILLSGCASGQVKQSATDSSVYTQKTPHPDGTGKVYLGREIAHVMSAAGGNWLERDTREEEEAVTLAVSKMPLHPNSVVADIGAGTGYYSFRIAPKIPAGKLYAVEVQDAFVNALERKKRAWV